MRLLHPAVLSIAAVTLAAQPSGHGKFEGSVKAEWLPDGRSMRLVEDFKYFDPTGHQWIAAAGDIVDGASIPRVFWTFVGAPFEGKYRNASVVHDVACDSKTEPWKLVHRMFYHASRLGGVGLIHGLVLYGAVYHFGPRWPNPPPKPLEVGPRVMLATYGPVVAQEETERRALTSDDDFLRMREYIFRRREMSKEKGEMTLEEVENLTKDILAKAVPKVPARERISPDDDRK